MNPLHRFCFAAAILFCLCAQATHIVGGTITYSHLGDSTYVVRLQLYRDCSVGNPMFSSTQSIQVRNQNGNPFSPSRNITVVLRYTTPVPSYVPCASSPGLCYEEGFYSDTVSNLPALSGGYHLYYQYCCRPTTTQNLTNILTAGISVYARIPDATQITTNSSPQWNYAPPLFVCQGSPMLYPASASDADGDSLVYSYYTPYSDPAPTFPSGAATFTPVSWANGFSATNPCGGAALSMNSQSGLITGTAPNQGIFAAAIRCEEFRNGNKIGEITRDYPFIVVPCPPMPTVQLGPPFVSCFGNTIQYTQNSNGANTYFWDFGDPQTSADTSLLANPSWLYANPGTYSVTVIINRNTPCTDTATQIVTVEQVTAHWTSTGIATVSNAFTFTDSSYTSDGAPIVMWDWDFGDSSPHSTAQNPSHTYTAQGSYNVVLVVLSANGCFDTTIVSLPVSLSNGMETIDQNTWQIFPNPSDGNFTISSASTKSATLSIRDMQGRLIYTAVIPAGKQIKIPEASTGSAPGIYGAEISNDEITVIKKLVIR